MKIRRIKFYLIILWLLPIIPLFAQSDSLSIDRLLDEAQRVTREVRETQLMRAFNLSQQSNYASGQKRALIMLAEWSQEKNDVSGTIRYYLEALNIAKKREEERLIQSLQAKIGDIYQAEGLFSMALSYYLSSIGELEERSIAQDSLKFKIGMVYSALSKPDSTLFYLSKMTTWPKKVSNYENEQLGLLHQVVNAYNKTKNYDKTLVYNEEILRRMLRAERPDDEMAVIYNNLGYNYNQLQSYEKAAQFFEESISLLPEDDYKHKAVLFTNIGIAYFNGGKWELALEALQNAKKNYQSVGEIETTPINHLKSNIYLKTKDLYNAKSFNGIAIKHAKKHEQFYLLSETYYTAAQIYANLYEYETALYYYERYFMLKDSLDQAERTKQLLLRQEQLSLEKAERDIRNLLINQEIQRLTIRELTLEGEKQELALNNLELETKRKADSLELLQEKQEASETRLRNQELLAQQSQQELQLTQQRLLAEQQDRAIADLAQKEELQSLKIQRQEDQLAQETQQNQILTQENEISQLELEKQQNLWRFAYGIGALLLVVIGLIFAGFILSRNKNRQLAKKNTEIEAQKEEITQERNKSEQLLLNILPAATAQELKEHGVAQPRRYENATVLFSDFVNFTVISSRMPPEELVGELNYCFQEFDNIIEKYGLEKIKTIGDAYMCVGGLPEEDPFNPQQAAKAAIEMMAFIQDRYEQKKAMGQEYWQMRIGLHTGPVVAGVVGHKKFVYDIWGDTVNTASRIESSSDPGRINLSGATFQHINQHFSCEPRGKVKAKSKGEIDMYFLVESN